MGEGMPLGAECALRARRLAASDPYQPADPRQGRQVYRAIQRRRNNSTHEAVIASSSPRALLRCARCRGRARVML